MPTQHLSVVEVSQRHPLGEVRAPISVLRIGHARSPFVSTALRGEEVSCPVGCLTRKDLPPGLEP